MYHTKNRIALKFFCSKQNMRLNKYVGTITTTLEYMINILFELEVCSAVGHKGHMPLMNQIRRGICPTSIYLFKEAGNLPLMKILKI